MCSYVKGALTLADYSCLLLTSVLLSGNAVIPKSVTPSRIEENLNVFGFSLDSSDMDTLNNLYKKVGPKGYRVCSCLQWKHSPEFPFASEL